MFSTSKLSRVSLPRSDRLSTFNTFSIEKTLSSFPFDTGKVSRSRTKVKQFNHSSALGAWKSLHQTAWYPIVEREKNCVACSTISQNSSGRRSSTTPGILNLLQVAPQPHYCCQGWYLRSATLESLILG